MQSVPVEMSKTECRRVPPTTAELVALPSASAVEVAPPAAQAVAVTACISEHMITTPFGQAELWGAAAVCLRNMKQSMHHNAGSVVADAYASASLICLGRCTPETEAVARLRLIASALAAAVACWQPQLAWAMADDAACATASATAVAVEEAVPQPAA
jgi:hypothetical protein